MTHRFCGRAQSHGQQLAQKRHDEAVAAAELAAYVAGIKLEDAKAAAAGAAKAAVAKQRAVDLACAPPSVMDTLHTS